MKRLSKSLSRRVLATLNKDLNFKDAYQMVCNKSKTKPYLVGGKLYRTLVELIYDYPARSHTCDFDFATCEIARKKKRRYKDKRITNYDGSTDIIRVPMGRSGPYSGDSIRMSTRSGAKIDLISISDLLSVRSKKHPNSIEGYFDSVPLSVQAIAMDLDKCEIFGKIGIDSINEKYVWVNNESVLKQYIKYKGGTADNYIKRKAESIKFGHPVKPKKKPVSYVPYNYSKTLIGNDFVQVQANGLDTQVTAYGSSLDDSQLDYLDAVVEGNVGIELFMSEGSLHCNYQGSSFRYNGSVFQMLPIAMVNPNAPITLANLNVASINTGITANWIDHGATATTATTTPF